MAFSNRQRGNTTLAEINITPLVDVMLVLLIIFMVTAPFLQEGIDVDLPQAKNAAVSNDKKDKILTISQSGQIFFSDDSRVTYTPETLQAKLAEIYKDNPDKTIYLRADKNVSYGAVVQIMSVCKSAGIDRIGMVTQPDSTKGGS